MRRFELDDGVSSKFWEVGQAGCELHIRFGRIGTAGQSKPKTFADEATAAAALGKLVREKTAKGYVEAGAGAG
ncbi:WGR domain-containing protein, partial [Massilia sp. CCM 8733]|nr:WGR domain-containing protein [Massilia mucilaginosa]